MKRIPPKRYGEVPTPVIENVMLFGDRVAADVVGEDAGVLEQGGCGPYKKKRHRDAHRGEGRCEDRGRDQSRAAARQGRQGPGAKKRQRRGSWPC